MEKPEERDEYDEMGEFEGKSYHFSPGNIVGGVRYPGFIKQSAIEELQASFQVREDDVFLLTHPKTGTTLLQHMISLLLNGGKQPEKHMMAAIPWLEKAYTQGTSFEEFEAMESPRCFKTHASPHLFPGDWRKPRIIIISRNPKDTMVSLFHHMHNKTAWNFEGDWNSFFDAIMDKAVENSCFFDWHLPWRERYVNNEMRACLWLSYEQVTSDLAGAAAEIASFLGLSLSDSVLQDVAAACTLDSMKANPKADCSWIKGRNGKSAQHLRRGGSGGWRDVFSVRQNDVYDAMMQERMQGVDWEFDFGT